MTIAIGSIVRLKSGGPPMTVTRELGPNGWCCQWFSGENWGISWFAAAALVDVDPTDESESADESDPVSVPWSEFKAACDAVEDRDPLASAAEAIDAIRAEQDQPGRRR